jgi:hypothetical protein
MFDTDEVTFKFVEGGGCDECSFENSPLACDYVFPCEAHDRKDKKSGHWEVVENGS